MEDQIACVILDNNDRSKEDLRKVVVDVLQLGPWNKFGVMVKDNEGTCKAYPKINKDVEGDEKYIFTREQLLEFLLAWFLS